MAEPKKQYDPFVKISIRKSTHKRLKTDRDKFSKDIGVKFSIDDTIIEYLKICNIFKDSQKGKDKK